jgi:CspA family cold shock protein
MLKGTVKYFNSDQEYGLIAQDAGGKDLFMYHSGIESESNFASLRAGQKVKYLIAEGSLGPYATNVVRT